MVARIAQPPGPTGGSTLPQINKPSKTARKARSHALQTLAESIAGLDATQREQLPLPARLVEAMDELERTRSFEGQRRQRQLLGKIMRRLDEEQVQALQDAWQAHQHGSATSDVHLHQTEQWRERLLADDAALTDWMEHFPGTEVQPLRNLIRQARRDIARSATDDAAPPGQPEPGRKRAYRALYRQLHTILRAAADNPQA